MKILRIDLRAYAQFSHKRVEFDPSKKIHLIFGRNETGKSSFTRAFKALLFGIEKRSKDSFLHSEENLFIEGLFESYSGKIIQVARDIKTSKKESHKIIQWMKNLDKKSYSSLFCLNAETILMGSKDLIENLRQFDQTLFSSIQGAEAASLLIKSIEKDLESLYKVRGSKPSINYNLGQAASLLDERRKLILPFSIWSDLSKQEAKVESEVKSLGKSKATLTEKINDLQILAEVQPLLDEYEYLEDSLLKIDQTKILNEKELIQIQEASQSQLELEKKKEKLNAEISTLSDQLTALTFDPRLISLKREVEFLIENYSVFIESNKFIGKIRKELEDIKASFKLVNLALQENINSSLTKSQWDEIRKKTELLNSNLKTLNSLLISQQEKLNKLTNEKKEIEQKLSSKPTSAFKAEQLDQISKQVGEYQLLEASLKEKKKLFDNLKTKLSLGYINFNFDNLLCINEELNELENKLLEYQKIYELIETYRHKLKNLPEISHLETQFSIETFQALKEKRKALSTDLLTPWNEINLKEKFSLFKKFYSLIIKEDQQEEYLIANIDSVAKIEKIKKDRSEYEKEVEYQKGKLHQVKSYIKSFMKKNSIDFTNLEHRHCKYLISTLSDLKCLCSFQEEQNNLSERIQAFKLNLSSLIGLDLCIKSLSQIQTFVTERINQQLLETTSGSKLSNRLEFLDENILDLSNEISRYKNEINQLEFQWAQITKKHHIRITFDEHNLSNFIKNVDSFFDLSEKIKLKSEIIEEKVHFVNNFEQKINNISGFTEIKPKNLLLISKKISSEELKKEKYEKLLFLNKEKMNDLKKINLQTDRLFSDRNKRAAHYQEKFGISEKKLIQFTSEYYSLKNRFDKLNSILRLKCSPKTVHYFLKNSNAYSSINEIKENLKSALISLEHIQERQLALQKVLGEIQFKKNDLNSFSKRYTLDDQLQNTLFELEREIKKYIVSKTAHNLVKKFIWDYQEENQYSILRKASLIFHKLTKGKYSKIQLNILNQKESFLICTNSLGNKVTVDVLSDGTRDQLFISLKFAMVEHYCLKNEPLPLILDDLLVNFDDERAISTLNFLSSFKFNSQIILFTHHSHILEFAKKHLQKSDYQVHKLDNEMVLT